MHTFFRSEFDCQDNSSDPLEPKQNRFWAYYRRNKDGAPSTEGTVCYYCYRVWCQTGSKLSLGDYKKDIGANEQSNDRHSKFLAWFVMKLTEQFETLGNREGMMTSVRLKWPEPWSLRQMEIVQMIWKMPEDKFQDHDEYMHKWNNLLQDGDKVAHGPGGKKLVKLRSEAIYVRQKRIIQQAQLERTVEDGTDAATQGTLGLQMQSLLTDIEQGVGLGASASSSSSVPALQDTPEAPPAQAQAKAGKAASKASSAAKASSLSAADVDGDLLPLAGMLCVSSPQPPPQKAGAGGSGIEELTPTKDKAKPVLALKKVAGAKKAAGADPGSGKKKNRGAPKRDAPMLITAALKQFVQVSPSQHYAAYLGQEWKSMSRNWQNWLNDLEERIATEENEGILVELQSLQKSGAVLRKFCNKWQTSGSQSQHTLETYIQMVNFCKAEPSVDLPFSRYIMKTMHGIKTSNAKAHVFWDELTTETLMQFVDEDEMMAYQEQVVAAKINVLTQDSSNHVHLCVTELLCMLVMIFLMLCSFVFLLVCLVCLSGSCSL